MTVTRRHLLLGTFVGAPMCAVLAIALLLGLFITTGRLPFANGATWFTVTKVGEAHFSDEPTEPFFFLAVGNDGRTGDTVTRGDAIHLIGVNPAAHAATILDIPRDTGAEIPGHGTDKINAAMAYGGIALQAETVGNLVGVAIPYAITTDFDGFMALVDGVGGVDVTVNQDMDDPEGSGAVFTAGTSYHMNGDQALRFSRDRHDMPRGDLDRSGNQGTFILAALAQLQRNNLGAAGTLSAIASLGAHTQIEGMSLTDLYRFGRLALSIDPANVKNVVIPVGSGSGTRLAVTGEGAGLFADFADDAVLQTH
jgi:polyisoprenyl-teichoic acid--peptidoglycan teichoic acid transferase